MSTNDELKESYYTISSLGYDNNRRPHIRVDGHFKVFKVEYPKHTDGIQNKMEFPINIKSLQWNLKTGIFQSKPFLSA